MSARPSPKARSIGSSAAIARIRGPGALVIIAICFAGSGLLRLLDPEGATARAASGVTMTGRAAAVAGGDECPDPAGLLAALGEREAQLERQSTRIADREQLLQVAEAKFKEQTEALRQAEERLAATLAIADEAAEADVERLVSVYSSMKPKDASRIFETMDVTFAAGFLARMREDAAARILGGMSPERAYAVSAVIAGRNAGAPRD